MMCHTQAAIVLRSNFAGHARALAQHNMRESTPPTMILKITPTISSLPLNQNRLSTVGQRRFQTGVRRAASFKNLVFSHTSYTTLE